MAALLTRLGAALGVSCVLAAGQPLAGERFQLEALKEKAPEGTSEDLRGALQEGGWRVVGPDRKPYADLWLVRQLATAPPKEELGVEFSHLEDGALLGVIRLHDEIRDYKGKPLRPGTFTLRRGIQPQDGDHLGSSDTRDFALLSPLKVDTKRQSRPTKEVVKMSVEASGTKHPSVLYLLKMFDEAKGLPRLVHDGEKSCWILDCELPAAGSEAPGALKKPVRIGLVIEGQAPSA
jgi:hypothetical protein